MQAANNVMLSLPESMKDSAFGAEPLPNGKVVLTFPDEWEPAVRAVDHNVTKSEYASVTFGQFMDRLTKDQQLELVTATTNNSVIKLWYDRAVASDAVNLNEGELSNVLSSIFTPEIIAKLVAKSNS